MSIKRLSLTTMLIIVSSCVIISYTAYGYIYSTPRSIHTHYSGIKYQLGNTSYSELVSIDIDGTYERKFLGFRVKEKFIGNLEINGKESYSSAKLKEFTFNDDKMASITNENFSGLLFADDSMKQLTILIYNEKPFDFQSGWIISGQSTNREQALNITNELTKKLFRKTLQ